jgi:hypothetical protein
MWGFTRRHGRSAVAALALLLAVGACSSKEPAETPGGTNAPSAGATTPAPGSSAAPSSGAPSNSAPATAAPGPSTTPGSTLPPPATTPVPPPTPGGTDETVAPREEVTRPPVKLDKPSNTGSGVSVRITKIKSFTSKAQLPGEVAGPAVAMTVLVTNDTTKPLDIGTVVVSLLDSEGAPGNEMTAAPAKPLRGTVKAGGTATGVYVFTVDKDRRADRWRSGAGLQGRCALADALPATTSWCSSPFPNPARRPTPTS